MDGSFSTSAVDSPNIGTVICTQASVYIILRFIVLFKFVKNNREISPSFL